MPEQQAAGGGWAKAFLLSGGKTQIQSFIPYSVLLKADKTGWLWSEGKPLLSLLKSASKYVCLPCSGKSSVHARVGGRKEATERLPKDTIGNNGYDTITG